MDILEQIGLFLQTAIQTGTPILFAIVGGILCEKVGHMNLGVEGMMLMGAALGFTVACTTGNPLLAMLAAGAAGAAGALIYAFITVTLRGNQVVTGLVLTIFGTGVSGLIGGWVSSEQIPQSVSSAFRPIEIPLLSKIPILGEAIFSQDIYVWLGLVIAILAYFYLNKTKLGLYVRAIGENPGAADASGINVNLHKYINILVTFLGIEPYTAVGIALASDILASAVSAYTYGKNKNLDIKNGIVMMVTVLVFTVVGSYVSSLVPSVAMGNFSVFMTLILGIKFIVKPVMTTKADMVAVSAKSRIIKSVVCGAVVGFICGFIGAGGGMMMLLLLTSAMGYELKTAVGTSVFIMTFTALTGSVSHFAIGGMPDVLPFVLCIIFTLIFARIAAKIANRASARTLNRVTASYL